MYGINRGKDKLQTRNGIFDYAFEVRFLRHENFKQNFNKYEISCKSQYWTQNKISWICQTLKNVKFRENHKIKKKQWISCQSQNMKFLENVTIEKIWNFFEISKLNKKNEISLKAQNHLSLMIIMGRLCVKFTSLGKHDKRSKTNFTVNFTVFAVFCANSEDDDRKRKYSYCRKYVRTHFSLFARNPKKWTSSDLSHKNPKIYLLFGGSRWKIEWTGCVNSWP